MQSHFLLFLYITFLSKFIITLLLLSELPQSSVWVSIQDYGTDYEVPNTHMWFHLINRRRSMRKETTFIYTQVLLRIYTAAIKVLYPSNKEWNALPVTEFAIQGLNPEIRSSQMYSYPHNGFHWNHWGAA